MVVESRLSKIKLPRKKSLSVIELVTGSTNQSLSVVIVLLVLLAVFSICAGTAESAVIYGQSYSWETLEPVGNVIITLLKNGTSIQQIVSKDGSYSFEVAPGNYVILAKQTELNLIAKENVTITSDVTYRYDLILFPNLKGMGINITSFPEFPEEVLYEEKYEFPYYYLAITAFTGAILVFLYYLKRGERKEERKDYPEILTKAEPDFSDLPEDLQEIVRILKSEGGRITQKELRKRLGCSEAKMSLMIADLERRGIIEKVKKGRGNIIFLKFI
jgi:uncharacterized membrane protein